MLYGQFKKKNGKIVKTAYMRKQKKRYAAAEDAKLLSVFWLMWKIKTIKPRQ